MMKKEHILESLETYIFEMYIEPFENNKWIFFREFYAQKSYSKWAANEFLAYLKNRPINPYDAAEEFIRMMDEFACSNHKERLIFSIGYDVGVDLLDYMIALR